MIPGQHSIGVHSKLLLFSVFVIWSALLSFDVACLSVSAGFGKTNISSCDLQLMVMPGGKLAAFVHAVAFTCVL